MSPRTSALQNWLKLCKHNGFVLKLWRPFWQRNLANAFVKSTGLDEVILADRSKAIVYIYIYIYGCNFSRTPRSNILLLGMLPAGWDLLNHSPVDSCNPLVNSCTAPVILDEGVDRVGGTMNVVEESHRMRGTHHRLRGHTQQECKCVHASFRLGEDEAPALR